MSPSSDPLLTRDDLLAIAPEPPDHTVRYGSHDDQVIDIYLPTERSGSDPFPVALLIHGGCWRSKVDRTYFGQFARRLGEHGIASCNMGYRRLGSGGGWPMTFEDVSAAADALRPGAAELEGELERDFEPGLLDLDRVVAVGHSAGGHLALWLAARQFLPPDAPGAAEAPLALRGVVAIAGIPDLAAALDDGICGDAVSSLLGGDLDTRRRELAWASPTELPPTPAPHVHLVGERDAVVPPAYVERTVEAMQRRGQTTRLQILPGAGHMEPVVADAAPWATVLAAIQKLLNGTLPNGTMSVGPEKGTQP